MHLLDVLVTQHATWTAKRLRRGLFGQSIVDFSTESWSAIQLQDSAGTKPSQAAKKQAKKTPRLLRSFAQTRIVAEDKNSHFQDQQSLVPGMSSYESQDVDMDAGTSPDSLSLSTSAVQNQTGTQEFDIFL